MPVNITKTELIEIIETDDTVLYLGTFVVGGETRAYYRCSVGAGDTPPPFRIVYIVV